MSDQYVFELQFKGKHQSSSEDLRENQFVIIDGSSMTDFIKLKEDLSMCMPEPFTVQYVDEEDDVISIDTEEEFQEFAKLAKQRSGRGMLMRVILNSHPSLNNGQLPEKTDKKDGGLSVASGGSDPSPSSSIQLQTYPTNELEINELKARLKSELKNEILLELKEEMGARSHDFSSVGKHKKESNKSENAEMLVKEAEYEEDSDGNMVLINLIEKKKGKLSSYQRKLEKKEKLIDSKIDQRLEKLEMKRKKILMEKAYNCHNRIMTRKISVVDIGKKNIPSIMSVIATKESCDLSKRVTIGKVFEHIWTVINDGTIALNNVELRHSWSSKGLEPEEMVIKVPALLPNQEGTIAVKFKAPTTVKLFISYWHFYRLVDSQWQQFSHYVTLTGGTKLPKVSLACKGATDAIKKPKLDYKTVSFSDQGKMTSEGQEEKVLNDDSSITLKKQMDVCKSQMEISFVSSQIAAEMAREAAKIRQAVSNNGASPSATKPSEDDKINNCSVEAVAASVQGLNLVDSGSDTEGNIETNEENDKGFVIVDIKSMCDVSSDKPKIEQISSQTEIKRKHEEIKQSVDLQKNRTVHSSNEKETTVKNILTEPLTHPRLENNAKYPVFSSSGIPNNTMFQPPHQNVYSTTPYPGAYQMYPNQPAPAHPSVYPPTMINGPNPKIVFPPYPVSTYALPPHLHWPHPPAVSQNPLTAQQNTSLFNHPRINGYDSCRTTCGLQVEEKQWFPQYAKHQNILATNNSPAPSKTTEKNPNDEAARSSGPTDIVQIPLTGKNITAGTSAPAASQIESVTKELFNQGSQNSPKTTSNSDDNSASSAPFSSNSSANSVPAEAQNTEEKSNSSNLNSVDSASKVQILPQALVDGAINVAATAYSTAWNALNNLRLKEGEASEFDPVFENNMAVLAEMGFNNLERNARLLKRFNNDISQVIGIICATGGAHNLDID